MVRYKHYIINDLGDTACGLSIIVNRGIDYVFRLLDTTCSRCQNSKTIKAELDGMNFHLARNKRDVDRWLLTKQDLENFIFQFIDPDDYDGDFTEVQYKTRQYAISKLSEALGWKED